MLPGMKSYATCIKFNPYLYEKMVKEDEVPLIELPYRMVWAVGTTD